MATQAELELVISMRDRAASQLRSLNAQMGGLTRTVQQLGHAFGGAGGLLAGAGTAGIAASVVGIGLAFDSTEEQARLAFETILGSGDKANDMIERVKKTALATPFAFTDILRSSQRLLAAGFNPDEIDKQMAVIADTISSTGDISREKLDMMTGAFARMRMSGVFSMEAIQELGSSGVNVIHLLAQQAGTTDFAMTRMLEHMSGRMPAGPMMERIFGVLQAKYGGLAAKQADTMQGVLNNIRDLIQQRLGAIMLPIFVRTEQLLRRIFYYLDQVREEFKKLPAPLKEMIKEWGPWVVLLSAALVVLPPLIALIGSLSSGFLLVGGAILAAVTFLTPIGPLLALIALAALTLYLAWTNNWFGIRDKLTAVWGVIQPILQKIWDFVYGLATGKISIAVAVATAFDAGWGWVQWLAGQVGKTLKTAWSATMDLLGDAWDWVKWLGGLVAGVFTFAIEGWLKVFGLGWDDIAWLRDQAVAASRFVWESSITLLSGGWTYVQWAADNLGKILSYDSMVSLLSGGWDYVQWAADNLGKILSYDSAVRLLSGGWDYVVWAATNLGKALNWESAVSLLAGGWTYLVWAADNLGKVLSWDSAVGLLQGGWSYVKWLADSIGKILHFDLTLNIGWVNEWVHKILDWIAATGGRIVNVGGGLLGGQSSMVAQGVGGGGGGSSSYTVNINGPVYADDIETQVARALDTLRRTGRVG